MEPDWRVLFGDTPAWQVFLWIGVVCGVLYLLIRLWPFVSNAVAIVNALVSLPKLAKQVKEIHHETHRNDGTSLKDAVARIEVSLEGVHGRLDPMEADVKTLRDVDRVHDDDVSDLRKTVHEVDGKLDDHLEWSREQARIIQALKNREKE